VYGGDLNNYTVEFVIFFSEKNYENIAQSKIITPKILQFL